jgi:hypothetical protein
MYALYTSAGTKSAVVTTALITSIWGSERRISFMPAGRRCSRSRADQATQPWRVNFTLATAPYLLA